MTRIRKIALALGGLLALVVVATAITLLSRRPSLTREWDEDVRVLSGVVESGDGTIELTDVRDWRYSRDAVLSKAYHPVRYDPADVTGLWLYEQKLGLGGRIAHTFLVFEFPERYGDDRWLGLSVETRRELGEKYSLVGGVLQKFEVTHIWAKEADLVRRRVEYLDYPLTRYRVTVSNENIARLFRQFVRETAELAATPRWYNTLTTNCTSSLITYVNEVEPGSIPWHYSFVFTGRADDYLARLGYLDAGSAEHITREWLAEHPLR